MGLCGNFGSFSASRAGPGAVRRGAARGERLARSPGVDRHPERKEMFAPDSQRVDAEDEPKRNRPDMPTVK